MAAEDGPGATQKLPGKSPKGRRPECQRVTAPLAVSKVTERMPGVPCGATHSTATSSSGFSTGSPSHSVTREAEPAMVRQLILRLLSYAWDGWSEGSPSHLSMYGTWGSA